MKLKYFLVVFLCIGISAIIVMCKIESRLFFTKSERTTYEKLSASAIAI